MKNYLIVAISFILISCGEPTKEETAQEIKEFITPFEKNKTISKN